MTIICVERKEVFSRDDMAGTSWKRKTKQRGKKRKSLAEEMERTLLNI